MAVTPDERSPVDGTLGASLPDPQDPDTDDEAARLASAARQLLKQEQRTAFLQQACGQRTELRSKVDSLLKVPPPLPPADGAEVTVPIAPQSSVTDDTLQHESPQIMAGANIGPYKVLQTIGEGGMGVVYMAEQRQPMQRKVALKVIKPGMDSKHVVARFEIERQALAMMSHPNIARVLDAGTAPFGMPYFVMELVQGDPISIYCDRQKLDTRARLELFVRVCKAVQHAHQKGIIHRDLKPSNVLVALEDNNPVPKVIDFGIAKAIDHKLTDKTMVTKYNQLVGTPSYMSPEQAEMSGIDIDTRTDIYSMGVILYELLTGTTPIASTRLRSLSIPDLQRIIREEEPPRPSTLLHSMKSDELARVATSRSAPQAKLEAAIRGELDWIVMKAIEKDRMRRYETANALADDVERYLRGDVVLARPPSKAYRLKKFARRNKGWLTAAAAVMVALIVGTAVSMWQAVRATQAERSTNVAYAKLNRQHKQTVKAERAAQRARQDEATARRHAEAVADFLARAFRSPDPEAHGRHTTVAQILDYAVAELADQFAQQPRIKARLLHELGTTFKQLSMPNKALPLLTEARQIRADEFGEADASTLVTSSTLAGALYAAGDVQAAIALYKQTIALMTHALTAEHVQTLIARRNLADIYLAQGDVAAAIREYEPVLGGLQKSLGPNDMQTLTTLINLAYATKMHGNVDQAIERLDQVLQTLRDLDKSNHPRALAAMNLLADAYIANKQYDKAIALLKNAGRRRMDVLGPMHFRTLATAHNLAKAYAQSGRLDEAIELYELTRQRLIQSRPKGEFDRQTLGVTNSLAVAYGKRGDVEKAIEVLGPALTYMRSIFEPGELELARAIQNMAVLRFENKEIDKAIELQEEALAAFRKLDDYRPSAVQDAARTLAEFYKSRRGDGDDRRINDLQKDHEPISSGRSP